MIWARNPGNAIASGGSTSTGGRSITSKSRSAAARQLSAVAGNCDMDFSGESNRRETARKAMNSSGRMPQAPLLPTISNRTMTTVPKVSLTGCVSKAMRCEPRNSSR